MQPLEPTPPSLRRIVSRVVQPLVALLLVIMSLSAPLAYFALARTAERQAAAGSARELAMLISREARERSALWRYDTPKLIEHLWLYGRREAIAGITVFDERGVVIDTGPALRANASEPLIWASAPILIDGRALGRVEVAASLAGIRRTALGLLFGFTSLATVLVLTIYVIPLRALERAELRLSASRRYRDVSSRALTIQEAERRAIARDLHDGAGQSLTALRIELELVQADVHSPERIAQHAARAITMTDAVLEDFRRALAQLAPAVLDEAGLETALHRLLDDATERGGFAISRSIVLPADLRADARRLRSVELACYRIVQETLTNVVRHASARVVHLDLLVDSEALRIQIADDGKGWAQVDEPRPGTHGLRGMRERAELLGGEFVVTSAPDSGTRVSVMLPLREDAELEV